MGLREGLLRRPAFRHQTDLPERHATWLELFYDLAFVAVLGQISAALARSHSAEDLGRFFLLFGPVWWAWVGQAFYLSRFDTDDLSHRVSTFLQIGVLAVMATGVGKAFGGDVTVFVSCYIALRVVLIGQYLFVGRTLPEARPLTRCFAGGFSVAVVVWALSLVSPAPWRYALWGLGVAVDFATPFLAGTWNLKIPPHPTHIPERFGLFTIIVLGEAIIADVASLSQATVSGLGVLAGVVGLVLVCCVWWVYFDGVKGAEAMRPVAGAGLWRYRLWLYGHAPLHAAIVLTALGVERVVLHPEAPLKGHEAYLLPAAVGFVMLFMHILYFTRTDFGARRAEWRYIAPHWVFTAAALVPLVFGAVWGSFWQLAWLAGCFLGHVFLTLRAVPASLQPEAETGLAG